MARKTRRGRVGRTTAKLVEEFARRWGEQTTRAVPAEVRMHARASIREGLLAMASVWEHTLRGVEEAARDLRHRMEQRRPSTAARRRSARKPR